MYLINSLCAVRYILEKREDLLRIPKCLLETVRESDSVSGLFTLGFEVPPLDAGLPLGILDVRHAPRATLQVKPRGEQSGVKPPHSKNDFHFKSAKVLRASPASSLGRFKSKARWSDCLLSAGWLSRYWVMPK